MNAPSFKVLLIEDNSGDVQLIEEFLGADQKSPFAMECVDRLATALERLAGQDIDAVLLDLELPDSQGLDTFRRICTQAPHMPVLVLTGLQDDPLGVQAVQEGAQDYLVKGHVDSRILTSSLRYAIERKRAEEALREKEQHLRVALEAGHMGTWEWNILTGAVHWSASLEAIHGLAQDTFGGTYASFLQEIHPQDRELVSQAITTALENQTDYHVEYRIRWSDGSIHWLEGRGRVFGRAGKPLRMLGVCHDITLSKEGQLALHASEQRYKQLLEAVTDYIYTVQVDQGRVFATVHGPGCAAVTGYSPTEFAADPHLWIRIVPEEDQQAVLALAALLLAGKEVAPLEHRIIHKNGAVRWIRNTSVVHKDARGRVTAYNGLISDISERKRAEQKLRASETRYRFLFENNLAGILRSTLDGRVLDCNESLARILGYASVDEVRACSTRDFYFHPEDRQALLQQLQEHGGSLTNHEINFRRKDGSGVWVLANLSQVVGDDGRPFLHGTIFDITERKRTEKSLRDSEALYQSLVESIPLHVFRKDLEGRFTFGNRRFCAVLGRPLSEILGKTDLDFYPRSLAEKYRRDDQQVLATAEVLEDTEQHQLPNGERIYVATVKTPVYDAQMRIVGTQGMFWDVTANMWAEEQRAHLRVARAIQQNLLPIAAPRLAGLDIGGVSCPAEACSGDYFDYLVMDNALAIVLADVSGHGFGPALLGAVTHACLRTLALVRLNIDIQAILATANRVLLEATDGQYFVTLLFARLDLPGRSLVYSSAGHTTGYVLDASGQVKTLLPSTGPILGVFSEEAFPTAPAIALDPGDIVLLVTDGIQDAMAPNGTPFGSARVLENVQAHCRDSAQEIAAFLCRAAQDFCQGQLPHDDITAVVIKVAWSSPAPALA